MSDLKKLVTGSPVHSRNIDMRTYPINSDQVVVEGTLLDKCYQPVFELTGDVRGEGPIHHLVLRLLIEQNSKEILGIEAEMIHVPHEECKETLASIKDVIGLKVEGGFIKNVMHKIGGVKGCSHMTHLLTVMSQEVFQGIVVGQRIDKNPLPKSLDAMSGLDGLIGSCKMWDKGGLKLTRIQKAIDSNRNPQ